MKTLRLKASLRTFDGVFDLCSSEHHLPEILSLFCRASPRSGKWRQRLAVESQREGLGNKRVQLKRARIRKTTNHSAVNPKPNVAPQPGLSGSSSHSQVAVHRYDDYQQIRLLFWSESVCVQQYQIRWVCHNWVHQSYWQRGFFLVNPGLCLRVVAVAVRPSPH